MSKADTFKRLCSWENNQFILSLCMIENSIGPLHKLVFPCLIWMADQFLLSLPMPKQTSCCFRYPWENNQFLFYSSIMQIGLSLSHMNKKPIFAVFTHGKTTNFYWIGPLNNLVFKCLMWKNNQILPSLPLAENNQLLLSLPMRKQPVLILFVHYANWSFPVSYE